MRDSFRADHVLGLNPEGFHRVAYTDWGTPAARRAAICVHGLTRQGRDFDFLAAALVREGYRVVCPDVAGRGQSDPLPRPEHYAQPQYAADMTVLIARLNVAQVDWIGTSMGGLIGMAMASRTQSPIRRLVLNDIGPFIPKSALDRIVEYLGVDPLFPDMDAAERYVRDIHAGFGPLTDEGWRHLTRHGVRPEADGGFRLRYDPAIAEPFRAAAEADVNMWPLWNQIRVPVLVLRGGASDVLTADTARLMAQGGPDRKGPKARVVEFPGVGHAPALIGIAQIETVAQWLFSEVS